MKIACIYKNIYENDNKRWIDEMRNAGYSHMEISVSQLPDDEAGQDEIISYALSLGFSLNLHAPYGKNNISSSDSERRESSIANVKHSIDLAAKHGLGTVTFHPGRLSDDDENEHENRERMMQVIRDIALYAKEKKVFVGLENMERRPYELVHTIADLNQFASLTENNPYFGATIDFAHYLTHEIGMPVPEELQLPLYDVHLSQIIGGKAHHALLDERGTPDLAKVCRSLKNFGYDGFVVLELKDQYEESKALLEKVLAELH